MYLKNNFYLIIIFLFISSCSSKLYEKFDDPILTENTFIVNDTIVKKNPVKLLIQPSNPTNKFLGYPLGLYIYNLSSDNPDVRFDSWIKKKPKRYNRLSKILSVKQINQLKKYNKSFNEFIKNLGQKPFNLTESNVKENMSRLKQFYDNEGYFDSKVNVDTIIKGNEVNLLYKVKTNNRYLIDSISLKFMSSDIDSLYKINKNKSFVKKDEFFSINKLLLERERLISLFKNNGIHDFQQRSINFNVLIDSTGNKKKIPLILSINNKDEQNEYIIRKINDISIYVESLNELSNFSSYTDSIIHNGIKIFSKGNLNYSLRSLTEPIFFKKNKKYNENDKLLTSRYFSNLGAFKYPRIVFKEKNDSLNTSIYLLPRDRFSLGFDLDFTHSNIEDFGISFGTNFNIRNIFRGTENLSVNLNNNIGASKDIGDPEDSFFNLF